MTTFYVLDHTPHFTRKKLREAEEAHKRREDKKAMRKLWDDGRETKGRPRKSQASRDLGEGACSLNVMSEEIG